jgi:hypothetical protein
LLARFNELDPGELNLEKFDVIGDRAEVAAGLIDLSQRERAFCNMRTLWQIRSLNR